MNIIVFSKDRAAQLDLFIRSFNKYVKNSEKYQIKVLYTFSNEEFKNGYEILLNKYNSIKFKLESNFQEDLIDLIYLLKHTIFFVDDNIFIRSFDFYDSQQDIFENNKNILCRSLRLNYYLNYSYAARSEIKSIPKFNNDGCFVWKNSEGDYNYPMSLDGHIYRTKEILPLLINLNYTNPNSLEGQLNLNRINSPLMICYKDSKIVNTPINRVQTNNFNYCGDISAESLNKKFCDGKEINFKNISLENTSCHMELEVE